MLPPGAWGRCRLGGATFSPCADLPGVLPVRLNHRRRVAKTPDVGAFESNPMADRVKQPRLRLAQVALRLHQLDDAGDAVVYADLVGFEDEVGRLRLLER